jgi:hypothetical protein
MNTLRSASLVVTSMMAMGVALVALPETAHATTPSAGVEQQIRKGFFTETDLGTYFDFKLQGSNPGVSNAQAYLQLGVGYDITERLSLSVEFGLGASAALCLADTATTGSHAGDCGQVDSSGAIGLDANGNPIELPDNFSNTFLQLQVSYAIPITDRLSFTPRVAVGYQLLDPAPLLDANNNPISGGVMVGGALALEYATHQDHFIVGVDVEPRFMIGPNLLSLAIFPRVKYTF